MLTTFDNHGGVLSRRQGDLIKALALRRLAGSGCAEEVAAALVRMTRSGGMLAAPE